MAEQVRPLVTLGPFTGSDFTTEPSFLGPGMAAACSNVDISANLNAFTIANGRTLIAENIVPAGYYVNGAVMFTLLEGPGNTSPLIQPVRLLLFSALNPNGTVYTGIYNTATGDILNATGTLLPFTSAVQFQDGIYTNSGQQVRVRQWAGPLTLDNFVFIISAWQPSRPLAQVFGSLSSTATTGPGAGTYSYAICEIVGRISAFGVEVGTGVLAPVYQDTTSQISAPYYLPGDVVIADGSHAPVITLNFPIATFPQVQTGGDYGTEYALFRSSINQPTYFQLPVSGDGSPITDTSTDQSISGNLALESPSIGVPPPFTFLLEQGFPPTGDTSPLTYYDYALQSPAGFCCNHKGRLWAYSLYPNQWDWAAYTSDGTGAGTLFDVELQSQIWWSGVGVPWQFDAVDGVDVVGPEEVVGNIDVSLLAQLPVINPMPWQPELIEDTPMGAASIGSELVLHKSNNLYKVWGDTGAEFTVYPIADIGTVSSASVTPFEGGDGWLAPQGAYFYNGGAPAYIGENIRKPVEALPFSVRKSCVGFYRDRTWYLSFPSIAVTTPPVITQETETGSYSGTTTVTASGTTESVAMPTKNATGQVSCVIGPHGYYICYQVNTQIASWQVTAEAPINSGVELSFHPASVTGQPANLQLVGPNGTVLQTWTSITSGTYTYYNAAAIAGTYTWKVTINLSGKTGNQETNESGTFFTTIGTPTLGWTTGSGTEAVTNGPTSTLAMANAQAPTSSATQITLTLSSVVTPSDSNGSSSFDVFLTDASGRIWVEQTGVTSAQTLTFFNANAPPGTYTWSLYATASVGVGGGTSSYACTCNLSATWYESSGGTFQTTGTTYCYYTPTQQWYALPYAVNAACTSDFPNNLAYVFIDSNLYTMDTNTVGDAGSVGVLASWSGNVSSGESPGQTKEYRYLVLDAPNTTESTIVTVNLYVDGVLINSGRGFTYQWDLSQGSTAHVQSLPPGTRGYVAQLTVSVTGAPGTIIRNVYAAGTVVREFSVTRQ